MLELKNISFSADGKQILKNINLVIDDAKFVVITGPNGGGKSTVLNALSSHLTADRFCWTVRTSQTGLSQTAQEQALASLFSSLCASKA